MSESGRQGVMQCGREITVEEIEQIRETVELFPGLAAQEQPHESEEDLHEAAGRGVSETAVLGTGGGEGTAMNGGRK